MRGAARVGCGAAMVAASFGFALAMAELGVRLHQWSHGRAFLAEVPFLIRDDRLGWRPNGGLRVERVLTDAAGTGYRAHVSTDRNGFRRFPQAAPGTPRILFLGDSFTHAVEVDDQRTYHASFARRQPDHAVFAIGAGGYGTLQEALLLEQSYPLVRPAIVIWQLCANDLSNNLFEAERRSARHNNLMRRPYLERGEIVLRNPAPWPLQVMERLYQITGLRSINVVRSRGYRALAMLGDRADEDGFAGADGPALRARAIAVTEAILTDSRARHPHSSFLSFNICGSAEDGATLRAISEASGLHFLGDYGTRIGDRRRPDFEVFSRDGHHFNERGHALLAEMLADDVDRWRERDAIGVAQAH